MSNGLNYAQKADLVSRLMAAKNKSGKTFDEIADALGLTNLYTSQLFLNQCQLKPDTAEKLLTLVPDIDPDDLAVMQVFLFLWKLYYFTHRKQKLYFYPNNFLSLNPEMPNEKL